MVRRLFLSRFAQLAALPFALGAQPAPKEAQDHDEERMGLR